MPKVGTGKLSTAPNGGPLVTRQGLSSPWRARVPGILVGIVVFLFLGLVAYATYSLRSASELGAGGRINTGSMLVRFEDRMAPHFELPQLEDETPIRLTDYSGKVVVVNFWGSWCPPCREEAPILQRFSLEYSAANVVVLGVDVWEKDWQDGRAFLREYSLTYPNVYDPSGQVTIDFGVSGVPETFVVSPDGNLLGKFVGPIKSVDHLVSILQEFGALPVGSS